MTSVDIKPSVGDKDRRGPLQGVRVLELGNGIAVGYAGRLLVSLGAEVWKLESKEEPDWVREYGTSCSDHGGLSCAECHLNGAKARLMMSCEDATKALRIVESVLSKADLVLIGEGRLAALCENVFLNDSDARRIIVPCVRIVGAVDGSDPQHSNAEAAGILAGIRDTYGETIPPSGLRFDFAQVNAGAHAAATATLALATSICAPDATASPPIRLDVGIYESSFSIIEIAVQTQLLFERFGDDYSDSILSPLRLPFVCGDGASLVINLWGKDVWQRMCDAMARPHLSNNTRFLDTAGRAENADALRQLLESWCRLLSRDEALSRMRAVHIPCAPVNGLNGLLDDDHVRSRTIVAADGAHEYGSISSCFLIDGRRPALRFVDIDAAISMVRSELVPLRVLTAPGTESWAVAIGADE